ncbi:MAG: S-methyl-5-thioribose-1-phosphate isomerase [Ectothiorhodospiraceae bacterium]|nr:S-methyl-5-thioribose-1-phosphate isomerase [Ectothiorhodospiraceae bacterium]
MRWHREALEMLDQRELPAREVWVRCTTCAEVASAITSMVVRGAPAIGVCAAYGAVLSARVRQRDDRGGWRAGFDADLDALARARPTAVNLVWAVERMRRVARAADDAAAPGAILDAAHALHRDDVDGNRRMGAYGAALLGARAPVLTHCNTGSLATGGYGTALGVIRSAWAAGKVERVLADETRPWLQGARLTAWELVRDGIPVDLLADGAAAWAMRRAGVGWVIVGADRVAANGDVANKIGTYALAVAARHHGVRFMVAAPTSTIDPDCPDGDAIPIELRAEAEVLTAGGRRIAAEGARAWNPVFDVTPAALVDALVTERGVIERPGPEAIAAHLGRA